MFLNQRPLSSAFLHQALLIDLYIQTYQGLQRRMSVWDSGFHGTKLLTMRSQSAVWPTATDMKDAITIPA